MLSASDAVTGGNLLFWSAEVDPPTAAMLDSAMFGRNDNMAFAAVSYNYIVMFQGVGVAGPSVARWQAAQDLNLAGAPLNNGFYPYPTAAMSQSELLAAPGGSGAVDSLTVTVFNAETLEGAWAVWLENPSTQPATAAAAVGTYEKVAILREVDPITGEIISEKDSVIAATPNTSSFPGDLVEEVSGYEGPQEIKHRMVVSDGSLGGAVGNFTHAVVSLEGAVPAPASTQPSAAQSLYYEYTDTAGSSASGDLIFGTFNLTDPTASTTFGDAQMAQATGLGGVAQFGEERGVSAEMGNLPLPPVGWFFEGWLMPTGAAPQGTPTSLGPIQAIPPDTTSLFNADIDQDLPSVTPTGIRFSCACSTVPLGTIVTVPPATGEGSGSECDDFTVNLSTFILTLEPKVGVASKNIADTEIGTLPFTAIIERTKADRNCQ